MLTVRRLDPELSDLPRHWYGGQPVLTHAVNALNLIFPDGERFFIRSVRHYEDRLTDPALRAQARAFYAQEGQHGRSHDLAIRALEAQGFEVQTWLRWFRHLSFRRLERWQPPIMRLSVTVALEHFTATFARYALETRYLDRAHPGMRDLLLWHAAEEIEHKSVAFDVFTAVGGGWLVRVLGLLVATAVFVGFWQSAIRHLHSQEPDLSRADVRAGIARARAQGHTRWGLVRDAFVRYLRPGFHPDELDDRHLARDFLAGGVAGLVADLTTVRDAG